jgi:hypothetical protein
VGDARLPLLSWRVAILPDLGFDALYRRFRLNEPWDSPHNKALLGEMPGIYRPLRLDRNTPIAAQLVRVGRAVDPTKPGLLSTVPTVFSVLAGQGAQANGAQSLTHFRAVVGPSTMFWNAAGTIPADAADGADQTVMIVETSAGVPWTKPDEFLIQQGLVVSKLGAAGTGGFPALMADGSVRTLPRSLPPARLERLFTRSGDALSQEELPWAELSRGDGLQRWP